MSDIPRTDARVFKILSDLQSGTRDVVDADLARELERENAALREDSKIVDELCALHGCGREFLLVWCRAAAYAQKAYARKEAQP